MQCGLQEYRPHDADSALAEDLALVCTTVTWSPFRDHALFCTTTHTVPCSYSFPLSFFVLAFLSFFLFVFFACVFVFFVLFLGTVLFCFVSDA